MATDKVRENKARRMAERQGLTLQKSRRRDPLAIDFGTYNLLRKDQVVTPEALDLDGVENYLTTDRRSDQQSDQQAETGPAGPRGGTA